MGVCVDACVSIQGGTCVSGSGTGLSLPDTGLGDPRLRSVVYSPSVRPQDHVSVPPSEGTRSYGTLGAGRGSVGPYYSGRGPCRVRPGSSRLDPFSLRVKRHETR